MAQAMLGQIVVTDLVVPVPEVAPICPEGSSSMHPEAREIPTKVKSGGGKIRRQKAKEAHAKQELKVVKAQQLAHKESKNMVRRAKDAVKERQRARLNFTALGHLKEIGKHLGPDGSWANPLTPERFKAIAEAARFIRLEGNALAEVSKHLLKCTKAPLTRNEKLLAEIGLKPKI